MNRSELAKKIDHTALSPDTTPQDIEKLCQEAHREGCAAVCLNPHNVSLARDFLKSQSSKVKIASVVGFPLGANKTSLKVKEAVKAVEDGAEEVDMVMNIGLFLAGKESEVETDISQVVKALDNKVVKVILETSYLSDSQKRRACQIVKNAGAHYVKTSTGFGPSGSNLHDIRILRKSVPQSMKVKAAGGIRWYEDARASVEAGAVRIGASSTMQILKDAPE